MKDFAVGDVVIVVNADVITHVFEYEGKKYSIKNTGKNSRRGAVHRIARLEPSMATLKDGREVPYGRITAVFTNGKSLLIQRLEKVKPAEGDFNSWLKAPTKEKEVA